MSWRNPFRGPSPGPPPVDEPWVEDRPERELTRAWLPRLREAGWVLPPSLARDDAVPSWTRLGVVDGASTGTVDPRGLVTIHESLSVDWAIGAEDRWYHPAREANVTQARVDGAPVVETTLRVPGGVVVHRAYGARGSRYPGGGDDWLVVEVENRSAVPVVLAWVVRPFSPTTLVGNRGIHLLRAAGVAEGTSGPRVVEVYDPVGVLPRLPSRWARTYDGTDPLALVEAGQASSGPMPPLHEDPDLPEGANLGLVSAALLTPLPHTATARFLLLPAGYDIGQTYVDDDEGATRIGWPAEIPTAEAVARGWTALAERGPRIEVPDPVLAEAVAAARRSLLLSHRVQREVAASDAAPPPATHVVTSGRGGATDDDAGDRMELLAALAWWGETGSVDRLLADWPAGQQRGGGFGSPAATAAALRALAVHVVASGDPGPAAAWLPEVGGAAESLGRALRRPPADLDRHALAEGLDAAAVLLARLDQPAAAAHLADDAARARAAAGAVGTGPDPDARATTPRALAAAAVAATRAGEPATALWGLLRRASPTWTWSDPEAWAGDDGLVAARLLDAVARLLVADRPAGPELAPWVPPTWWGLGWELHGAPTRWGRLSYAVRWHGDRPAVLWELDGGPDGAVVRAPGLDPEWSSTERRGEALLAPVAAPEGTAVGPEVSTTGGVAVAAPPRSVWRPQDAGPDAPAPAERPPPDEAGSFS